jgi:anti-sigma B factor antagonist
MTGRGFTMVDHFAESANPVSADRHGFEVQESWSDRLLVLSVCDAVDVLSAPQLTETICGALAKAPAGLIVDLTEVNFLASVGMSILVATQEAADAMSVPFGVVAEGAATSRPIRLLGIDAIMSLYPTLSDALHDLR